MIVGPSGSGKTTLLQQLQRRIAGARRLCDLAFPLDVAVVDAVAPTRPLAEAAGLLTACGLGEPRVWLRRFDTLSEGERFRARLARSIALHRAGGAAGPLICDDFGAVLHDRLARSVAFNLRRIATREHLNFVCADVRGELAEDLQPDRVIRLGGCGCGESTVRAGEISFSRRVSFAHRLRIEPGRLADYASLAHLHYRESTQVGFVDHVFVLRDGAEIVGVVVYGRPTLELAVRNRVTRRRFARNPRLLNRELRVLKRLILHPDLRGCGLGHWLVEETLPKAGARFVECLASIGLLNPVFERAGMRWLGLCRRSARMETAIARVRDAGADPMSTDFPLKVSQRPALRRLVARCVYDWYRSTGAGRLRVEHQSAATLVRTFRQLVGSSPAYFLWCADPADWRDIDDAGLTLSPWGVDASGDAPAHRLELSIGDGWDGCRAPDPAVPPA